MINNEEVIYDENESSYNIKSPFLKGEVVKDHINRCLVCRSKEMKKGYYNSSLSNSGEEIKEYIHDTRKTFISSVKALKALLYPEIKENSEIDNKIKEFEEAEKKIFNNYAYDELILENGKLESTGRKYIPEEDDSLYVVVNNNGVKSYQKRKGVYNDKISLYWNEMIDLYDLIFSYLNLLIHKKEYFSPEQAGY